MHPPSAIHTPPTAGGCAHRYRYPSPTLLPALPFDPVPTPQPTGPPLSAHPKVPAPSCLCSLSLDGGCSGPSILLCSRPPPPRSRVISRPPTDPWVSPTASDPTIIPVPPFRPLALVPLPSPPQSPACSSSASAYAPVPRPPARRTPPRSACLSIPPLPAGAGEGGGGCFSHGQFSARWKSRTVRRTALPSPIPHGPALGRRVQPTGDPAHSLFSASTPPFLPIGPPLPAFVFRPPMGVRRLRMLTGVGEGSAFGPPRLPLAVGRALPGAEDPLPIRPRPLHLSFVLPVAGLRRFCGAGRRPKTGICYFPKYSTPPGFLCGAFLKGKPAFQYGGGQHIASFQPPLPGFLLSVTSPPAAGPELAGGGRHSGGILRGRRPPPSTVHLRLRLRGPFHHGACPPAHRGEIAPRWIRWPPPLAHRHSGSAAPCTSIRPTRCSAILFPREG